MLNQLVFSQSWFQQQSGTTAHLHSVWFVNPNTGWVSSSNGFILKTTNGGNNWISFQTGSSSVIHSLQFLNEQTGYACGDGGLITKSTNGGINWTAQSSGTNENLLSIKFINAVTGWVTGGGVGQGTVRSTTNGGINWIEKLNSGNNSIFPLSDSLIYTCDSFTRIRKSSNSGTNWSVLYSHPLYIILDIHFINQTTGFAAGNHYPGNYILKTTNSGNNWTTVDATNGYSWFSIFFVNENTGWTCSWYGSMSRSTNSGNNWVSQNLEYLNFPSLNDIYFSDSLTGWAVGFNGVIIKTTNGGNPIGIEPLPTLIPDKFLLYQNYPNPFNPATNIKFDIPSESHIELNIYDALGRKVEDLVSQNLRAGSYSVDWNASAYPSGVYFYKITAGGFTQTRKMVLLK